MPFMFQPTMGQGMTGAGRAPAYNPGGPMQPAGGSNPYYAPPPESTLAAENYAQAQDAYRKALARLNTQRTGLLRQHGYVGDVDPNTGMVKNVRVDASNSFGQLQQLLHGAAEDDISAENAAEDRGLVGGLAHQGEAELHYQHQGQLGDLANSLMSGLSGFDDQQQSAKEALDQALFDLQHQAVQGAISGDEYNPAPPAVTPGGGRGSSKSGAKVGSIPQTVAALIVRQAIAAGQPVSEHGLGQMRVPKTTHYSMPNAYTSGRKKRG